MTATYAQARDDILTMVKTVWDTTGLTMVYDDVAGEPPAGATSWARSTIRHNEGRQTTLADAEGKKRFERTGLLIVQIFTPSGEGLSSADDLAKVISDAFEGQTSPRGVWFKNVRVNEVGPSGNWYQVNVVVEFQYDEVK